MSNETNVFRGIRSGKRVIELASSRAIYPTKVVCTNKRNIGQFNHITKGKEYKVKRVYNALHYLIEDDLGYERVVPKLDFMIIDFKPVKMF